MLTSVKAWVSRLIVGYGGEEFLTDVVKLELMMSSRLRFSERKEVAFQGPFGISSSVRAFQLELIEGTMRM